jgi:large subunit ribosomal protein L10|tara:strand:- start:58 stop:612 length:555 start_codon:yes stop_codon:yes gene_type:complete
LVHPEKEQSVALKLEDKKVIVAEVNEAAGNALSAVVADYRGMEVGALTEMREKARNGKIYLRVVRNTLAKRAVAGTEFECLTDALVGPSLIGFSLEEPSAAAKLFKDIAKDNDKLEIRALAIGGQLLDASQVDAVAKLPTKDEAIAMLMSVMTAPVAKFVRTMNEVPGKLVRTVAAVGEAKKAG